MTFSLTILGIQEVDEMGLDGEISDVPTFDATMYENLSHIYTHKTANVMKVLYYNNAIN
jgi:hypothetical protein